MPVWQMWLYEATIRSWLLAAGMDGTNYPTACYALTINNTCIVIRWHSALVLFLVFCSTFFRIRVFGFKKGKPLAILNYHSASVTCVAFPGPGAQDENRNFLVCGSKDKRISLWRLY